MESKQTKCRLLALLWLVSGAHACSVLGFLGTFAHSLYSTAEPDLLLLSLNVYEEGNPFEPASSMNVTLDLSTGSLSPEVGLPVTMPPLAFRDPEGGYVLTGSWPNYTLSGDKPDSPSTEIQFNSTIALFDVLEPCHFVSRGFGYVFAGDFSASFVAIVDLSEGIVVNYVELPGLAFDCGRAEPDFQTGPDQPSLLVYESMNVVALPAMSGTCVEKIYLYYNQTTVAFRFTQSTIGVKNSLNALSVGQDGGSPVVFLLDQSHVVGDPPYSLPGPVSVAELLLSTGEIIQRAEFMVNDTQLEPTVPTDGGLPMPPTPSPSKLILVEPTTPPTASPSAASPPPTTPTDSVPTLSTIEEPTGSPTTSGAFTVHAVTVLSSLSGTFILLFLSWKEY